MEDYDKFIQTRLNHLRKNKEDSKPSTTPSLICFHGKPILPPLLSDEQWEEMKLHREAAQKTGVHRKMKEKQIKDFVQNVLDTVQLRNPPTLDNFLQELNLNNSLMSPNTTDELLINKSLPCSTTSMLNGKEAASQISSTSNALFASSSLNNNEVLRNHRDDLEDYQSSLFYDASHFSSEQSHDTDEFWGSSLDTLAKIPNIINYPPLDAEELGRNGKDSSLSGDFITVRDICSSSFQSGLYFEEAAKDLVCENVSTFSGLESDSSPSEPCAIPPPNITQVTGYSVSIDVQEQQDPDPSEKPQRRSLQALLQKSQEYRQQQRMLRNQAKSSKTQDRAKEPSHSDKENQQVLYKKAVGEWRKTLKEKRKTLPSYMAMTNKYSGKKYHTLKDQRVCKKVNITSGKSDVHRETLQNNTLNITPKGTDDDQPKSPLIQESLKMNNGPSDSFLKFSKVRKHSPILAPTFSNSVGGSAILNEKIKSAQLQVVDETSRVDSQNSSDGVEGLTRQVSPSSHANHVESEFSRSEDVISDAESTVVLNTEGITGELGVHGTACRSDYNVEKDLSWVEGQPKTLVESSFSEESEEQRFNDEAACEMLNLSEVMLVKNIAKERKNKLSNQPQQLKRMLSVAQWKRVPDVFRKSSEFTAAAPSVGTGCDEDLDDSSWLTLNHSCHWNESSDPSPQSDAGSIILLRDETRLTPDSSGGAESGTLKVKRRLLMSEAEEIQDSGATSEGLSMVTLDMEKVSPTSGCEDPIDLLKQIHAEQIRALQNEHRRQQRDLLQALTMRCGLPQSVSFPCSRLEDKVTLAAHSRQPVCLPEHHRPLLLAAVKGFLTRRLLKTERVAQLVRTIGDMQTFLLAFQLQSSSGGGIYSKQDCLLQARVAQQLQAARYDFYDIFFSLSVGERMQLISLDRTLQREKQFRHQGVHARASGGKKFLSAVTRRSLERKREVMAQKTAAKCNQGNMSAGHKSSNSGGRLLKPKRGQFRVNSQRDSKNTNSSRLR